LLQTQLSGELWPFKKHSEKVNPVKAGGAKFWAYDRKDEGFRLH
jgi:hypothetical protein